MTIRDYLVLGSAVGIAIAIGSLAENVPGLVMQPYSRQALIRLLFFGIVLALLRSRPSK
jgi:hypothetical protein